MATIFGSFSLPTPEAEVISMYPLTKTSLDTTDTSLLATVTSPKTGDIAVISTVIDTVEMNKSAYMYNDDGNWVALNGNVEADKVIMTSDITMAGNYTQVGNLTKSQTGTATFATKGLSVADALTNIFSKRLQPTITANPSLGEISFSTGVVHEVGTSIESISVSPVTFSAGSYTYGPATGVTASNWTISRVTNLGTTALTAGTGGSVVDSGPFVIGDISTGITSLKYTVGCSYSAGTTANDNLGDASNPPVAIAAGTLSKSSTAITAYRKFFYQAKTTRPDTIDSAYIRSLPGSTSPAYNGKSFNITVPEGATIVTIAYPATWRDLTYVKDVGAFGTNIVSAFEKSTVPVEGANGFTAIDYKVFVYKPAAALGANTYQVTI